MKLELFIGIIALMFIANIYYEGQILNKLKSFSKYYKMGIVAFVGLCVYLYIKRTPQNAREFFSNAAGYIKYLPIDRNTTSMLAPVIDFTGRALGDSINSNSMYQERRILTSGQVQGQGQMQEQGQPTKTKRSVSETKKKYVAASQNWCCQKCEKQLPAWFEVDHVVKLEYGGSNNVDNLVALCRDCHGKKTALENL